MCETRAHRYSNSLRGEQFHRMAEHLLQERLHLDDLSVVIPVAPGDDAWRRLLPDLALLPGAEVIFAATQPLAAVDRQSIDAVLASQKWSWMATPPGRACQLNAGSHAAGREFLWILHADSRFAPDTVSALEAALRAAPDALHFFDLAFLPDGPRTMPLNTLGARLRSRWLGMPFGDQGLCIRRMTWNVLGGFDESAPYGEDHLFVWRARRAGIMLRATNGTLRTSARRYSDRGWARTTLRHVWLTVRQALPEWLALVRQRVRAVVRDAPPAKILPTGGSNGVPSDHAQSVAIAVWVKTPGVTPAKTRLARVIGTAAAEEFHQLAVHALREIVDDACRLAPTLLAPYWAVAEGNAAAHSYWSGFPVVAQGEGGLGERLAHVYDELIAVHRAVIFIGADSPQLSAGELANAAALLVRPTGPKFVLGPAADGGFYLFGGRRLLPGAVWTGVTYSAPSTAAELIAALERVGRVELLGITFDVDTIDDLLLLRDELAVTSGGGIARQALREWLASVVYP